MSLALASRKAALLAPWLRNPLWAAARAVPSLDLRFADSKSLTDAVSGQSLITFTRASGATFTDSQGVIRNAVTNLLLRSEEFDDAYWSKFRGSVTVNAATAPNGSLTAEKLVEDTTATSTHGLFRGMTTLSGPQYTFSVYLKAAERTAATIRASLTGAEVNSAYFDLSNGAVLLTAAGYTASIADAGNGWYRCSVTATSSVLSSVFVVVTSIGVSNSYTGDGTSGIFIWGAQLEQSATVGEYIPTGATINSAPRFDHNPTTGESLGLQPEEQRTNLLLRSEEFQTTWTAARASISADATNAPNGTLTADRLIDTTDNNTHVVQQSISLVDSTNYAFSVFLKADQLSIVRLQATNKAGTACLAYFNLLTGTVSNESNATGLISPFPDGWYRCTILFASATGATAQQVLISPTKTAGVTFYIGNGTDGLFLWGAQLEAGAFASSYIPTTGTAATRSADVASITSSAFSGWYRQSEGTMFVDVASTASSSGSRGLTFSDGTVNNQAWLRLALAGSSAMEVYTAGGFVANIGSALAIPSRTAGAIRTNDFAVSVNGGVVGVDSAGGIGTYSQLNIGANFNSSGSYANAHIRRLSYWPQRLSNEVLQRITQ